MSKTTLKKALAGFGETELRQLILDIYAKSKDAKELLDFFAEPDIEQKLTDYKALADKEVYRFTRHAHRPRMSRIKAIIRRLKTFETGDEAVAELMVHICLGFTRIGSGDWLPQTVHNQVVKFFDETLAYLAARKMLDTYTPILTKAKDGMSKRIGIYRNPLRAALESRLEEANKSL